MKNPASGTPGYSHTGSGPVAGKSASGGLSTVMSTPANKPPVIAGGNMAAANVGGMEHVQTSPQSGGPKKGGPAPLQTNRGGPGVAKPGAGNPV